MVQNAERQETKVQARPILKWAGGKTQLLAELLPKVPKSYNKYIEPFFGGGALFFAIHPPKAIIADSNPELINLYDQVSRNVYAVISELEKFENTQEMFYAIRSIDWTKIAPTKAAARTIYLNKTCFNGLYRVNRYGQFNVPYGKYKNPKICDEDALVNASQVLATARVFCSDYKETLKEFAEPGDFIFLDPPYLPISEYGDFKRYTKEQFYEEDHVELANAVKDLHRLGCHVILTNSNHPLVHDLYGEFNIEVVKTKRHISCNGSTRSGEDVIIDIPPRQKSIFTMEPAQLPSAMKKFPATRFMGSKRKLLPNIWDIASQFDFNSAVDLFSGSGIVGYMFKAEGKRVVSNDYMAMSATFSKAMIENNSVRLSTDEANYLLKRHCEPDWFVSNKFKGLYFTDEENQLIDIIRSNIANLTDQYKKAIAMTALIRACMKKRPRGVFTYVGQKYDDGRQDLQKSFEQQFIEAVMAINDAVFDNGQDNVSKWGDAMDLKEENADLVYIDPPYYSQFSDNEYVRRYHFVEGLARNWEGVEIQEHTQTKKFKSYPTPFSSRNGAYDAFDRLFKKFSNSILLISYSSNCLPAKNEMISLLSKYKSQVDVVPIDYKYSFGNQNDANMNRNTVKEYLFVGY